MSARHATSWDELFDGFGFTVAEQQEIAALLDAYRAEIVAEVTGQLRRTPRYDRDYPALLRAARRIEEWASP